MNENKEVRTPRRHGPPGRGVPGEKAKDIKKSTKRLVSELRTFKLFIIISLTLASLGSVLSIFAPNKLSEMTDEISAGLIVNINNIEKISTSIMSNINDEKISSLMSQIMIPNIDQNTIAQINISKDIKEEDKKLFNELLTNQTRFKNEFYLLDEEILKILLNDSTYNNTLITKEDKIKLIKSMNIEDKSKMILPTSVMKVMFNDIKINNTLISVDDQIEFVNLMSKVDMNNQSSIYKELEKAPQSIYKVIKPKMKINKIKNIAIFMATIYILSALFTYIESILMTTVSNNFAKILRSRISIKINKLPLHYFDKHQFGDILSRVTNDIDTVAQTMNQSLATLVSALTLFIGTIIMMFYTNYIMAITAIVSSLFGFIFMSLVLSKSQKYFIRRQKELGELNGHIEEVYSGLNVVKCYNGKEEVNKKFDELNSKLYDANRMSQFLSGLMPPMMGFIGNFGYVAVCIVGALLTLNNQISFGVIVAFITYVRLFTSPLSQIAQSFTSLQSTLAASERVFEFLDENEMIDESKKGISLDKSKVKGDITFTNVSFTYDGNDKPTIVDFNANIKAGMKIAIVGPTGAGKTTMVNLLMKFYELSSGDIKIDGVSTKDLTRENIHSLFTMVLQDTWLFNGTIKENIIYNRENVSDEKVHEVCKIVGLDHFIKTLPQGYDSSISDNDSVSSGQRQLLTIARGMIEDAPLLILDEATSNVDTRTEELVQNAMDKLTEGRTSFIIAHRLSTIRNADLILVMDKGNIIEQGTHDELISKNGFYANLYNSQFEKSE